MRGELYCETEGRVALSLPERGSYSVREESGYTALDGKAENGTEYVTLTGYKTEDPSALAAFAARELGAFLARSGTGKVRSVLVTGIGNARVEADSLGPLAAERVKVGETADGVFVFSFVSGVPESTGIPTERIVPAVARLLGVDLLLVLDSLAAVSPERLCRAVQISRGVRPGSGSAVRAGEIKENDAGCPAVTLGVPTAVRGRLSRGGAEAHGFFTLCGIGSEILFHSAALSEAIGLVFGS